MGADARGDVGAVVGRPKPGGVQGGSRAAGALERVGGGGPRNLSHSVPLCPIPIWGVGHFGGKWDTGCLTRRICGETPWVGMGHWCLILVVIGSALRVLGVGRGLEARPRMGE